MKLLLIFSTVSSLSACVASPDSPAVISKKIIKDVVAVDGLWNDMRTSYVDGEGISLSGTECMTVFYNQYDQTAADQFSANRLYKAGVAEPSGNDRMTFSHDPIQGVDKYNYFFLSPHHITTSSSRQARLFPLQFPGQDTFDPNYDFLIGRPIIGNSVNDEAVIQGFKRLTAPVKVVLEDLNQTLRGEELMTMTVSFDGSDEFLSGYFSPDMGDDFADAKITYYSSATGGNALTAVFPEGLKPSGNTYHIWLSLLPADFPAGQKISFTATGRTLRASGEVELPDASYLSSEKLNSITLSLTSDAEKTESLFQDFSTCVSTDKIPVASDGQNYQWSFTGTSVYKTSGKYGMHGGIVLKTNTSSLSVPDIKDKVVKALRVYSHEETYSHSSITCDLRLKSDDKVVAVKSMNPYGGDVRNGGYVEFTSLADKKNLTLEAVSSDGSTSHIVPISAISFDLVDAEDYLNTVECYDYPDNYRTSTIYSAKVNGETAYVFQTEEPHVLAFGCKEGTTANVEITADGGIRSVIARPKAKGYDCTLADGKVILNVKPYDRVVVEINGDTSAPLFVFVNPIDNDAPSPDDAKVVYVPAGTIRTEDVILNSGQTLYVAGGGVLAGRVYAKNKKDITVRGYGVIDGIEDSPDGNRPVMFEYTDDIILNDCIVLNRTSWTVNMFECNDIVMDNCKIIATKNPAVTNGHQNDGFSIIGSDRMKVTRGFSYSHDDAYSIKTSKWIYKGAGTDILYDDIIVWNNTYGHGIELGTGLNEDLSGVVWRNCYILHSGGSPRPDVIAAIGICHAAGGTVSNVLYENIWIEDCRTRPTYIRIYKASDSENVGTGVVWSPGKITNVTLRNIYMDAVSPVKGVIQGYDQEHKVELTIENMIIGGTKVTSSNYTDYFDYSAYSNVIIR